jgi:hypothetical protein
MAVEDERNSTTTTLHTSIDSQSATTRSCESVVGTEMIKTLVLRLWDIKEQEQSMENERNSLLQQLNLAYLQGQMHQFLDDGQDDKGYQINPELTLIRRTGNKHWNYSLNCQELEAQLKEHQRHEQQNGAARYLQGPASWEIRMDDR